MPLVKSILQEAMKKAFVAGETAMEVEAKKNIIIKDIFYSLMKQIY